MRFLSVSSVLIAFCMHTALAAYQPGATRALQLSRTYDTIRAIKVLHIAHKKHPRDDRLSYRLAYLFHTMNRREQAEQFYLKTLELKKCHAASHNNLGNIYLEQGKKQKAIERFQHAVRCQPDYALPYYNLGNVYRRTGQDKLAIQHYHKTLQLQANHRRAHHNLALIYIRQLKQLDAESRVTATQAKLALQHINRAIQLGPRDAISYYNRGRLYEGLGSRARAQVEYERCLELLPETSGMRLVVRKKIKALQNKMLGTRA